MLSKFLLLLTTLLSSSAAFAASSQQNPLMSMVPLVLVFMVFYFLMLRPQKKKLEEEKKYLESIKKGEEIYTKSGIIGTVYGITDKVITLEVENGAKLKILRTHVGGPTKDIFKVAVAAKA